MAIFKANRSTIPPGNLILISGFYHILLFLGDIIFGWRFKRLYEIPYLLGVDTNFYECRADGDFILDDSYEWWVELLVRHAKLLCWYCWGGWRKDLGLPLHFIYFILCGGERQALRYSPSLYLIEILKRCKASISRCWDLPGGHSSTGVGRWGL